MKTRILIASIILSANANANPSAALPQDCELYPDMINRLQELNARGGTARQHRLRRKRISDYEDALYQCRNHKTIAMVSGEQKIQPSHYRKLRRSYSHNPQLQQLIKTCNYWVEQTRQNPSWDNSNFRDTACRAADEGQRAMYNPSAKTPANLRKLSDCIKPNNVIDDSVNQCLKGTPATSENSMPEEFN